MNMDRYATDRSVEPPKPEPIMLAAEIENRNGMTNIVILNIEDLNYVLASNASILKRVIPTVAFNYEDY